MTEIAVERYFFTASTYKLTWTETIGPCPLLSLTLPSKNVSLAECFNSGKEMTNTARARYTLEFKQDAVWLDESGQGIAAAARTQGVVDQTLFSWVKA